jgi:DNA invertase Pin-like site-specific DNA recombinase
MEIEAFAKQQRFLISTWHQDVWTGAGADALQQRPGLAAAIQQARSAKCPLIVSRLDRLSRNLHFISGLIEHRVHFIVAELGGVHDNFTLHIWASIAEQERKMLAERVTAALAAAKARGVKLGQAGRSKAEQRRCSRLANAKNSRSAMLRAQRCWANGAPRASPSHTGRRPTSSMRNSFSQCRGRGGAGGRCGNWRIVLGCALGRCAKVSG